MRLIEYMERAGIENMKVRIEVSDIIRREASTTLTLLLSGAGGALGLALSGAILEATLRAPAFAISVYLFILAALVNRQCLSFKNYPALWNEPENLKRPDLDIDQLRSMELDNLQLRIKAAITANADRAVWLNRLRYAATITPIIGFLAWLCSVWFSCPGPAGLA